MGSIKRSANYRYSELRATGCTLQEVPTVPGITVKREEIMR
jgi:hypothetical protein